MGNRRIQWHAYMTEQVIKSVTRIKRMHIFRGWKQTLKERAQGRAQMRKHAQGNEPLSSVLILLVLLTRKHLTKTIIILPKIILAGFQVLHSSACEAELSWACGRVIHHVLGFRQVLAKLGRIWILNVWAYIRSSGFGLTYEPTFLSLRTINVNFLCGFFPRKNVINFFNLYFLKLYNNNPSLNSRNKKSNLILQSLTLGLFFIHPHFFLIPSHGVYLAVDV